MAELRIVTINILGDLNDWQDRGPLLAKQLNALEPDLVALQEVIPTARTAEWLAEQTGLNSIHQTEKTGEQCGQEAVAILSRLPFTKTANLDLQTQDRVAQCVWLQVDGHAVVVANGHFYWHPGDSSARLAQVRRFCDWLDQMSAGLPVVACGDFNGFPKTRAIDFMQSKYASAYALRHGHEPELTFPTPLARPFWRGLASIGCLVRDVNWREISFKMRGTLDYIFVNPLTSIKDCQIVLDRPAPGNPGLYPSDHFGLMATLEIGKL